MTNVDEAISTVERLELELLTPACRSDRHRVDELLHPDFVEFGVSGHASVRQTVLEDLEARPEFVGMAVDVVATRLAPEVVLVTYRIDGPRPSFRSSVWVLAYGRWRLRFHQGTTARQGTTTE